MRKLTTSEFIKKAISKHSDKYSYKKVVYLKSSNPVLITCNTHGDFLQTPNAHLAGKGCPRCANNIRFNKNDFISKSKEIHGDTFDYSQVNFVDRNTKVNLICRKCNKEVDQTPRSNLMGNGCRFCSNKDKTRDDWIKEFQCKHGDFYDYSNVHNKIKGHGLIKIICPFHGEFKQTATKHKYCGCKRCSAYISNIKSNLKKYENKKTTLYYIRIDKNFFKIGLTQCSVIQRFKEESANIEIISLHEFDDGADALKIEQEILLKTDKYRVSYHKSPIKSGWTEVRSFDISNELNEVLHSALL